jgi:hypothetical protein
VKLAGKRRQEVCRTATNRATCARRGVGFFFFPKVPGGGYSTRLKAISRTGDEISLPLSEARLPNYVVSSSGSSMTSVYQVLQTFPNDVDRENVGSD